MQHELRFQKGFPEYRRLRSFERDMWAADEDAELKVKKKTILDNWFPISQVTASTYQHNEKLPQTQSEQEPLWCIYLQKYLNFKAWNSSKKRKNIKSSTHPSTRRLTSLSRSALRYLGWKYRRSRDHNLGFSWTFRCFRTEVLHSKNAEAWGLQHQIFSLPMLISILYTLHLCLWFGCCNSLEVRAWGKGTGKAQTWGNLPKKKNSEIKKNRLTFHFHNHLSKKWTKFVHVQFDYSQPFPHPKNLRRGCSLQWMCQIKRIVPGHHLFMKVWANELSIKSL